VQTIHNLAYQGLCGFHWADALDIPARPARYDGLEFHGHMSLFKAGLVLADAPDDGQPALRPGDPHRARRAAALGAAAHRAQRPARAS
jgi:hypothetical protein